MYKVQLRNGAPVVLDQYDRLVPDAMVHRINFPEQPVDTENGQIWMLAGQGTADISVNGKFYLGVPLV